MFSQQQEVIGQLGPAIEEFNRRLAATGGIIEGNLRDLDEFSKAVSLTSQTLRAQFINGLQDAVGAGEDLDEAIGAMGLAVRRGTEAIVDGVTFLYQYRDALLAITVAIGGVVVAAKTLGALQVVLAGIAAVASPLVATITAVVVAVAALGGLARIVQSQWQDHFLPAFVAIWESIKIRGQQVAVAIGQAFVESFLAIKNALNGLIQTIEDDLNDAIDLINVLQALRLQPLLPRADFGEIDTSNTEAQVAQLRALYQDLDAEAQKFVDSANRHIVEGFSEGFDQIGEDLDNLLQFLSGRIKSIIPTVEGPDAVADTGSATREVVRSAGDLIKVYGGLSREQTVSVGVLERIRDLNKDVAGTERERAQRMLETRLIEERFIGLSVDVRNAIAAVAARTKTLTEAMMGLDAAGQQAVLDFDEIFSGVQVGQVDESTQAVGFTLVDSLRDTLNNAVLTGDWSSIGDSLFNSLRETLATGFINRFADYLNNALSQLLRGEGFGGFDLSNLPSFQHGGTIPGNRGDEVLVRAHAGETIIPEGQNAGTPIIFENTFIGDPTLAVRRSVIALNEEQQRVAYMAARANGYA